MVFKIIIGDKGKAWRIETESEELAGKSIGDKINGKEIKPELDGYELEITGGSDIAGFPLSKDAEGIGLKRVLLKRGFGMRDNRKGLRLRKTLRGKQISSSTIQVNMKVLKSGSKKFEEIFPEQNKKVAEAKAPEKALEAEKAEAAI